ncbi:MAG: carboxypeptidase regulatory-like domain-containing protein [Acidobacteriota bacterium]
MRMVKGWQIFLLGCLSLYSYVGLAQTVGASLHGTVTDSKGAVQKAKILIKNTSTGIVRELETSSSGTYRATLLPPGDYVLELFVTDHPTVTRDGIHLDIGDDPVIDFNLQSEEGVKGVAAVGQQDTFNNELGGLVGLKQIRDLPLNGRSFQQLAILQPGVTTVYTAGNDNTGGRLPKISINGARPESNSFLLDGTDINNIFNKTPGSVAGVLLGVEAVLEFRVLTNAYSAEFGRAGGGVVNIVTRSGANEFHGSGFEFLRNSALDAKNFFDPANRSIPPFKRNQFGGVIGGPIKKDKTFFFASFESLIERLGVTGVAVVPDEMARQGILPGRTIKINPIISDYLKIFFPLPNGRSLGGGLAEYLFSSRQPTDEYFVQGRIDHYFSNGDSLFGRYTFDSGKVGRQPTNKAPVSFVEEKSRNQYLTLEYQHAFSPSLLNDLRVSYNRSTLLAKNKRTVDIPSSLNFIPGQDFGFFGIAGLASDYGGDNRLPLLDRYNVFQLTNNLYYNKGIHNVSFGFTVERLQYNQDDFRLNGGTVGFFSLDAFLQGTPGFAFIIPDLDKVDTVRSYRQSIFSLFAQDNVRLRKNLSLTLGLRYEYATAPREIDNKTVTLANLLDKNFKIGSKPYEPDAPLYNFAPRVSFSWDPFNDGKTNVRGGFGIFYDQTLTDKYQFLVTSAPFINFAFLFGPNFPNVLSNFNPNSLIPPFLQLFENKPSTSYFMQYNFGVERVLGKDFTLSVAYVGSRGNHLLRTSEANLANFTIVNGRKVYQPQLGPMNPNFSSLIYRTNDAQSFYNSLQIGLLKPLSNGLRLQLSYTFSRSVSDTDGANTSDYINGPVFSTDVADHKLDRGLSSFHAKHNLSINSTYDLPLGRNAQGLKAILLKGWQINNITSAMSGHPFSVQLGFNRIGNLNNTDFSFNARPDLKAGYSNNPILGGPDRYFDVNAFELQPANHIGNLGRNTLIGPSLVTVDTALVKTFQLREGRSLQFRAEVFNALNRPNFAIPSGLVVITSPSGTTAPNAGRITSTVTTSRQIQFALKFDF